MKFYVSLTVFLSLVLFGAGCTNIQIPPTSQATGTAPSIPLQVPTLDNTGLERLVQKLFDNLDSKKYTEAYALFSNSYKNTNPFQAWSEGYKNTLDHSVSSIRCENGSCVADIIALEITKENLQKQRYVLRYDFSFDARDRPVIESGTLLSNSTVEIVSNFDVEPVKKKEVPVTNPVIIPVQVQAQPTPSTVPQIAPSPVPVPAIDVSAPKTPVPRNCCKICTTGKACGNSCISRSYTCHKGPGCACDG